MKIHLRIIHSTDFYFQKFCEENYGINRGVYNTIDNYLFEKGFEDILNRRKAILSFLQFVSSRKDKDSTRIKFGNGGLSIHLNEYFNRKGMKKTVITNANSVV